jgi:membrane protease YdiL (CAAX protease family)
MRLLSIVFYFIRFTGMYEDPKSFPANAAASWSVPQKQTQTGCVDTSLLLQGLQLAATFVLIEAALWTPVGMLGSIWVALAVLCMLLAIYSDRTASARNLGLVSPWRRSSAWILASAILLCPTVPLTATLLGFYAGPGFIFSVSQAALYAVWSVVQQFILQSFFFLRLESLIGGRRAVWAASLLFGAVHLPNPVLTVGAFLGGLFFCEMFRRYRNILPLGLAHAMLGLTVAASFPDTLLRHMLVGEAYLGFHL